MKNFIKKHQLLVGILIGILTTFVVPYLVNYLTFLTIEKEQVKIESKTKVAEQFIADLERVKIVSLNNSKLQECLDQESQKTFEEKYEDCFNEIRQNEEEAHTLLNRNISGLKIFFGDDLY